MDRRIKYTKKTIKEVFLKLLSEKEINKITVSELCKEADINRATFYRYYLDVYDLLDKIEKEFINELNTVAENKKYTVYTFSEDLLQVFVDNKDMIRIIFKSQSNIYFLHDFIETAYEKCKQKWTEDLGDNLSEKDIENSALFIFNGALGVINYWIQNDFEASIEEISETITQLSYTGIKGYLYKK